jgi:tetratricopeptide (TPR) repeat protein
MSLRRGVFLALLATLTLYHPAFAQPSSPKEAGRHFQRGVTLYNETDYRAALIEFQRAYDIAPNAAVLYNIGETYFQLQNYAAALVTLERYLSDAGASAPHRAEVEQTLETLHARVGKVAVTANVADCDATIDDESVGKTPLREPVLVSIGRRKVTVTCEHRAPETRYVDVAAGDTVPLQLRLADPSPRISAPAAGVTTGSTPRSDYSTAAWYTAAAFATVGAGVGIVAVIKSRNLDSARKTFPVTKQELDDKAKSVKTWSLIGDIAGGVAVAAAGVGLYYTLTRSKTHEVRVAAMPHGVQLVGSFR